MKPASAGGRFSVFLVDDHPIVRAACRRLIELEHDFIVTGEFSDVDLALIAMGGQGAMPPDAVIVDLAFQKRSGLDLIRTARTLHPAVKTLVFSMHDTPAVVRQALACGASAYVTKACATDELVRVLRRMLHEPRPVLSQDLGDVGSLCPPEGSQALTLKEIELLKLLAAGVQASSIARQLQLSPKTVSNCQAALKRKLGAASPADLLRYSREHGLVV